NPANPYAHYDKSLLLDFLRSSRLEGKSTPADRAARYSNLGFGLLGYLLEEAHAQSYETLIRRKILEPLGMENTFLKVPYAAVHRQATPYSGISPVSQWDFKVLAGTGALWSTAPDLARFAECLLYPERFDFSDSVSLLKKPLAAMGGASIGLGLLQENIWQYDRLYHDGGTGGFSSSFVLTPSTGQYFVVLANQSNGFASRVANKLMQASVSAGTSETPSPTEAQPGLKTVNLALYQGKYTMGPNSTFHVQKFDDHLYVRLTGQLALPVRLTETDRFVYSDVEASLEFIRDPSGKIKSLSLHQNGRVIPAPKTGDNPGRPFLLPDGQAEEYAGKYALGPEQIFEVRALNRQLLVQLTGQPALPVLPSGTDRFEYDVVEAFLIFNRDPSGEVSGLVLHQNGLELPAPKQ
ncbi:MAG TPA: serine hydrolase, partial [Oceanipulchritudo sp.]|nr:serine hydrolase [Oceanipulchritudo sp.]